MTHKIKGKNAAPQHLDDGYLQEEESGGFDDVEGKKAGKWTAEEDDLLRKYVPLYGEKQWRKIAEHVPGRNSIQCLHRWTKILKPGLVKGPWTPDEDQKLIIWVNTEGPTKWAQCSAFIQGRSGKQCRERWFNNLDPGLKKGGWTEEEDEMIFEYYQQYGSSWSKIAKLMPGRTENAIKNRFYSTLRKLAADKKKMMVDNGLDDDVKQEGNELEGSEDEEEPPQQQHQPVQRHIQPQMKMQPEPQHKIPTRPEPQHQQDYYQPQQQMQMQMQMQMQPDSQNTLYKIFHEKTQKIVPNVKVEPPAYGNNPHPPYKSNMDYQNAGPNPNYASNYGQQRPSGQMLSKAPMQPQQQSMPAPDRGGYHQGQEYNQPMTLPKSYKKHLVRFQNPPPNKLPALEQMMMLDGANDLYENEFERFLVGLNKMISDDYISKEIDYTMPLEILENLDRLQNSVFSYCQNDVKDLSNAFKKILSRSAAKQSLEQEESKENGPQTGQNEEEKASAGNSHRANDGRDSGEEQTEQNDSKFDKNQYGKNNLSAAVTTERQMSQYIQTNPFDSVTHNEPGSLASLSLPELARQLSDTDLGPTHSSMFYKLVGNVFNDNSTMAEQRMIFLYQQLASVDSMLMSTKNELIKLESELRVEDAMETGFGGRRDDFSGLERGNPIIISNNEDRIMGDVLRKK